MSLSPLEIALLLMILGGLLLIVALCVEAYDQQREARNFREMGRERMARGWMARRD